MLVKRFFGRCIKLAIVALCILPSASYSETEPLRIRAPQSEFDASHSYFQSLIELALAKTAATDKGPNFEFVMAPYMVQQRALEELRAGRLIDIYWAGSNREREASFRAIPIPLAKGLLGFRVFAIHKDQRALMDKMKTLDDLKELTLCQGAHWPDTDIMLAAGLNVQPGSVYENMFRQVTGRRCDAFPRGIHEAYSEVAAREKRYPGLELYSDMILYYPFPMYLFVNKNNEALAQRLQKGLEIAIDDGSFDRHITTHPVTQHLFPLDKWINRRYIKIDNPFLGGDALHTNKKYWIMPPE